MLKLFVTGQRQIQQLMLSFLYFVTLDQSQAVFRDKIHQFV
ncbi:hypothetical protein [Pontibacter sp. HSC-14F20]|nr:hypothetical protein [Pontibacter sp. HSC-14F20]